MLVIFELKIKYLKKKNAMKVVGKHGMMDTKPKICELLHKLNDCAIYLT